MTWKSINSQVENASSLNGYSTEITWTDITSTSYAISGGAYAGFPATYAFDNSDLTAWDSSQLGSSIKDTSYIGQNFGSGNEKTVNAFSVKNTTYATPGYSVSAYEFQASNNGSTWVPLLFVPNASTTIGEKTYYTFKNTTAYKYYRLLARESLSSGFVWEVMEIEMFELTLTNIIPTTDSNGHIMKALADLSFTDLSDTPSSLVSDDNYKMLKVSSSGNIELSDAASRIESGYVISPEGLVIQWGTMSLTSEGSESISFPVTFPNACYRVILCGKLSSSSSSSDWYPQIISGWTTSGFTWYMQYDNSSSNANGGYYIAIGR